MSYESFGHAMLLLIFASFLVERSLAVLYESDSYIRRLGSRNYVKPVVAVIYSTIFVGIVGINLVKLITSNPSAGNVNLGFEWTGPGTSAKNVLIIVLTGIFVAGGSKASLKLFRDVMQIKSSAEMRRTQSAVTVPANPAKSGIEAATGNNSARQLSYALLDNYKSLTG